jgi:hypothetical protein
MEGMPIGPKDTILIIDLFPHAGDRAKAVRDMTKNKPMDVVYMGCAGGGAAKYIEFAKRRLQVSLFQDWVNGTAEFTRTDDQGNITVARPCRNVPPPTQEQLAAIPGAMCAWQGLNSTEWQVLQVCGGSLIMNPKWQSEFSSAPQAVYEEFSDMVTKHKDQYQNSLEDLMDKNGPPIPGEMPGDGDEATNHGQDPRAPPITEGQEGFIILQEYGSKEILSASVKLIIECKSQAKGVEILRDEHYSTYLVSSVATKLPANTVVGGFGSGSWAAHCPDARRVLQWQLAKGDKTVVCFHAGKPEKEAAGVEKVVPKETTKPQTMYAVLVDLEKKGNLDIKVSAYGLVKPMSEPGRHGYDLTTMDPHKSVDFILAAENTDVKAKYSHGNCFAPGTTKNLYEGTRFDSKENSSKQTKPN